MNLRDYQKRAIITDQNRKAKNANANISPLGLIGEIGSLASVYKKYLRDRDAYEGFKAHITEEIGDTLWYIVSLADAHGVRLKEPKSSVPSRGGKAPSLKALEYIDRLLNLSSTLFHERKMNPSHKSADVQFVLNEAVHLIADLSRSLGLSLEQVMTDNLEKTRRRWGPLAERKRYPKAANFDSDFSPQERLPRKTKIVFRETKRGSRTIVHMTINGMNVGDPITDNAHEPDGYRFHDTFHWSYVAVLGWSPVIRSLLKAKRKSDSAKDEVEDGARAAIVEEAITFQIFNYARQNNFLEGLNRVDHDLLKTIRSLTKGLEIEKCAEWEWEKAILDGYKAFRQLKKSRNGILILDADKRKIVFKAQKIR